MQWRGLFVADTILAKHDERYMPPQLGEPDSRAPGRRDARAMIAEAGLAALWLAAALAALQLALAFGTWRRAGTSGHRDPGGGGRCRVLLTLFAFGALIALFRAAT